MNVMTKRHAGGLSVLLMVALILMVMAPAFAADKVPSLSVAISSFTDSAGSININVGKAEGIKVGSRGTIMRDGQKIADYEVVQVNWGFSRIEVFGLAKGEQVRAGDSAPITTTPTVKKSSKSKTIWIVAALVAVAALLGGRHSGGSGGAISLSAVKTSRDNSGEATSSVVITARVNQGDGTAAPDLTPVTFSSTAGMLVVTQGTTRAGVATATLTHTPTDTQETAVVTAKALGKTATITISFASSLTLTASPTTIQVRDSDGSPTSSTLTATCQDALGNPVAGGTVRFSTSLGTVASDTVIADSNGIATTTYNSTSTGKATITATWLTNNTATVLVTVNAGPPATMTTSSSSNTVQCDGNSNTTITATVKDSRGNPVTDGTVVNFSVTPDGSGGGNGTITAQSTTSHGAATATLMTRDTLGAVSKSGIATIKAEVRRANQPASVPLPLVDIETHMTTVQFIAISVGSIIMSPAQPSVRGWDIVGNTVTITANVKNTDQLPVPNGTAVFFSANHGTISSRVTTMNGTATATLTTDAYGLVDPTWDGWVDITATSGGVPFTQAHVLYFSGPPVLAHCSATLSQSTIPSSGGTSTVTVRARDANDHPVANGTTVHAETTLGSLSSTTATTTDGTAYFTLTITKTDPLTTGTGYVRNITIESGGGTGGSVALPDLSFTVN